MKKRPRLWLTNNEITDYVIGRLSRKTPRLPFKHDDKEARGCVRVLIGRALKPGEIVGFELVPIKPAKKARKNK